MIELPPVEPEPQDAGEKATRSQAGQDTQWKKAATPQSSRGALLALATLLFCAVAGVTGGFFLFVGSAKQPYLITIPVENSGPAYPPAAAADADAEWLSAAFGADDRENARTPGREARKLRDKLKVIRGGSLLPDGGVVRQLETDRPLVLHVVSHVAASGGQTYLLPGDAGDDPTGWVPLEELLDALRGCPSRDKCLLLDVGRPRTRTFAGPYADDASAPLHAQLKGHAAGGTLPCPVIVSCAAGEESHVIGVAGVSAFAFYAAEGLRGAADGVLPGAARDQGVTFRELHAFLKLRVGRWAKRNRDAAQTPTLYADEGSDFKLTYARHARPPAIAAEDDAPPVDAGDPYRESVAAWRVAAARPTPPAAFPGRSIFEVPLPPPTPPAGTPPAADSVAAVRRAFEELWKARSAAKADPAKTDEAQARFKEASAAVPPELVGRVLWEWLLQEHPAPKTDLLKLLQSVLAPIRGAGYRELATLDAVLDADLADYTASREVLVGKLFGVEREFATLLGLGPTAFAWVEPGASRLVARQRSFERQMVERRVVTPGELEELRSEVAALTVAHRTAQDARRGLDFAFDRLRGTAHAVAEFGLPGEKPWSVALDAAARLAERVDRKPEEGWRPEEWARLTAESNAAVKPLLAPHDSAALKSVLDALPKAGPAQLRVAEATRATPFLSLQDRDSLNLAIHDAAKRLHAATRAEFDLPENDTGVFTAVERPPAAGSHEAAPVRRSVTRGLLTLAGLTVTDESPATAWSKDRRVEAAELAQHGDLDRAARLVAAVPFDRDTVGSPRDGGGRDELLAQRRQREIDAYRAWRATCSR